jgi:hypothetical protein
MGFPSLPKGGKVGVAVGLMVGSKVGVRDSRAIGVVDAVGDGVGVGVPGTHEEETNIQITSIIPKNKRLHW